MSNLVFPSHLPGIKIEMSRAPVWKTTVHESVSGCETAIGAMTYPRWRYKLEFEVLRAGAEAELQQLVGFFNRHGGRADSWLYLDDEDHTAVDQQFGVGDGVTATFYLYREFGGFLEPVTDVKTIDYLTVAGSPVYQSVADYPGVSLDLDFTQSLAVPAGEWSLTLDFLASTAAENEPVLIGSVFDPAATYTYAGMGRVQFSTPPAAGAPLRWSGEFYRRCRFNNDIMDTERFLYHLWKSRSIEFQTSRRAA